jgi:8-oxo-dGTP pyrophosphatase MutT (NUDIX family)
MSEPVPVRDAATVVLLRDSIDADGVACPEAWLLTRVARMVFAPSTTVFPGGRVDDEDAALPWSGRPAHLFADEFGCDIELAHALVGAAVREVFEETGVLLSTPAASLAHAQPDVEAGRLAFGDLLAEHGLAIDADSVRPWARWVTPEGEQPRRYDTRFFVAALPDGVEAADLTTESSVASWVRVTQAVADYDSGARTMMPPTIIELRAIARYATVADVLAAAAGRSLVPFSPTLGWDEAGGSIVTLPDGTVLPIPGATR